MQALAIFRYSEKVHRILPIFLAIVALLTAYLFKDDIGAWVKGQQFANSPARNELSSKSFIERILLSDGKYDPNSTTGVWFNQKLSLPNKTLANLIESAPQNVLGDSTEEKWIDIDLSAQKLYAKEGDRIVYEFPISSGLPWMPTVTGDFRIWAKVKSQRMSGGSIADGTFYDLPNVPFVQYFHNGYGIHGAYWHNDFGKPRSHGCVNMRNEDAKTLFYWTNPPVPDNVGALYKIKPEDSTRVVVHGVTPTNIY